MSQRKVTAAELMAKLNAEPEFVAARQKAEAERQQREAEWRAAETPLLEDLRDAGHDLHSVWDLVNTPGSYPAAVPILLNHVDRSYPAAVREGIARALAVPDAKIGWDLLVRLYREEQEPRVKDGLAAAISAIADDALIHDLISLARDRQQGPSRVLLLSALGRSTDAQARASLMDLQHDDELKKEAELILRKLERAKR
jgi:hypothetical protein